MYCASRTSCILGCDRHAPLRANNVTDTPEEQDSMQPCFVDMYLCSSSTPDLFRRSSWQLVL